MNDNDRPSVTNTNLNRAIVNRPIVNLLTL